MVSLIVAVRAQLDERLDHVAAALGHAVGKVSDRDGLGEEHLADDLRSWHRSLMSELLLALLLPAEGCERAHTLLSIYVLERPAHGELAPAIPSVHLAGLLVDLSDCVPVSSSSPGETGATRLRRLSSAASWVA